MKRQKNQKQNQPTKTKLNSTDRQLTFAEHLRELRSRVFWVVLTVAVGGAAGFTLREQLLYIIMKPLNGQQLIYLTPGGGFNFVMTVAVYFGLLVGIPVITYHLYRFLQPVFRAASRRIIVITLLASSLLAAMGVAFGYLVSIPAALDFLATFAGSEVIPNFTAESYLSFVVSYTVGLAALFQLPLLLVLLDRVRPIPPGTLANSQRYVITGVTVLAAVITPTPDAFNMAMVAVPILAMYQVGVLAVFVRRKSMARVPTAVTRVVAHANVPANAPSILPQPNPVTHLKPIPKRPVAGRPGPGVPTVIHDVIQPRSRFVQAISQSDDFIIGSVNVLTVRYDDHPAKVRVIRRRHKRPPEDLVDEPWLNQVTDFRRPQGSPTSA